MPIAADATVAAYLDPIPVGTTDGRRTEKWPVRQGWPQLQSGNTQRADRHPGDGLPLPGRCRLTG